MALRKAEYVLFAGNDIINADDANAVGAGDGGDAGSASDSE